MRSASGTPVADERVASPVEELLAGELLDTSGLAYDFDGHHLGLAAAGAGAAAAIEALASMVDRRALQLSAGGDRVWGWLGGGRIDAAEVADRLLGTDGGAHFAIGDPAEGLSGWRLTHRQARTALPIALRGPQPVVCYADVALLATIVKDELLVTSLRARYLEPLEDERDGGEELRQTLRAYFAADRNVSLTGASLGVSRQAVARRLRLVEEKLGRPIRACGMELEAALRYEALGDAGKSAV